MDVLHGITLISEKRGSVECVISGERSALTTLWETLLLLPPSAPRTFVHLNVFTTGIWVLLRNAHFNLDKFEIHFRYSYSVDSTLLDTKRICEEGENNAQDFAKNWREEFSNGNWTLPMKFINHFLAVTSKYKVDIGETERCERYVKAGIAVVRFQLADLTVLKIKKQMRSTVAEIFGSIGESFRKLVKVLL